MDTLSFLFGMMAAVVVLAIGMLIIGFRMKADALAAKTDATIGQLWAHVSTEINAIHKRVSAVEAPAPAPETPSAQ